jgi:hypothetical protein
VVPREPLAVAVTADEGTTYRVAACGECLEGKCDDCEMCRAFASMPGAQPHESTWLGDQRPFPLNVATPEGREP